MVRGFAHGAMIVALFLDLSIVGTAVRTSLTMDLSMTDQDEDGLIIGDKVRILSGKYRDICTGTIEKIGGKDGKVNVRRSCPEGNKGNGKTWWYKPEQLFELIPQAVQQTLDAPVEVATTPTPTAPTPTVEVPVEVPVGTQDAWKLTLIRDHDFLEKHTLCERYADVAPVNPLASVPLLAGRVVVRRGQHFNVQLISSGDHTLSLVFLAALPAVPQEVSHEELGIVLEEASGEISVKLPADMPVGKYELRVSSESQVRSTLGILVLFNPFSCYRCPEYVGNNRKTKEQFLEEYVGGDEGLLWQGLSDNYGAHPWRYEPFRAANLLISISLLTDLPLVHRADPTRVARHLTFAIGDRVCYGKWGEGDYAAGQPSGGYTCRSQKFLKRVGNEAQWAQTCVDPSVWTSSTPLLEQHWGLVQAGSPGTSVQYCQCFVFSGVMTTIGRALGLGTRSVTNFQSAHDTNGDRSISKFFFATPDGAWDAAEFPSDLCPEWCGDNAHALQKGCNKKECAKELETGLGFGKSPECAKCIPCMPCGSGHDSVWSFHVWNEMFFKRFDQRYANGWQAVDATPQEESGGRYQMGPASLRQIKKGDSACFDADFVVAEVNADIKLFVYKVPDLSQEAKESAIANGDFKLHDDDPLYLGYRFESDPFDDPYNNVGFKAVTKVPGPISSACRADSNQCKAEELDVTGMYKKCPHESHGGSACAAGPRRKDVVCGEVADPSSSLIETSDQVLSEGPPTQKRSLNHIMANKLTAGDVSANFDGFVPTGNVYVGQPLTVQCTFSNTANALRTVNVRLSVTACDYRGIPVIALETRRQKYPMRLPLEGMETELRKSLTLGPGEEVRFEQMIDADNLDPEVLSSLEVDTNTGTYFLQFHFSAYVEETSQFLAHEPRRALAES